MKNLFATLLIAGTILGASEANAEWGRHETVDDFTDEKNIVYYTEAVKGTSDFGRKPAILIYCWNNRTSFIYRVHDYLDNDPVKIHYRLDKAPSQNATWGVNTKGTAAGRWGNSAISFLRKLRGANKFVIEAFDYRRVGHRATFNLTGLESVLQDISKTCGWELDK